MMKTAIVTGASGFIGGALVQYLLEKNYKVIAVVRDLSPFFKENHSNLNCIEIEFSDYEQISVLIPHADIFYHLAWEGAYGSKTADYNVQLRNVRATCDALIQAVKIGCKKFVLAGTVAQLEIIEHIDKNDCYPRSTCIYAMAKLAAEMMCKTLATKYNIEFNCGLFANIIGPGDYSHRSTNTILNKFLHNETPKLVKGEGLNDWLYIKDAVRLIEAMGSMGKNMKTYYIGHTNLWSLREIIEKAKEIVAPELNLIFGELPDAFLTNYSYISTTELFEDTGYRAEYDFKKAILETTEWVKTLKWENEGKNE